MSANILTVQILRHPSCDLHSSAGVYGPRTHIMHHALPHCLGRAPREDNGERATRLHTIPDLSALHDLPHDLPVDLQTRAVAEATRRHSCIQQDMTVSARAGDALDAVARSVDVERVDNGHRDLLRPLHRLAPVQLRRR